MGSGNKAMGCGAIVMLCDGPWSCFDCSLDDPTESVELSIVVVKLKNVVVSGKGCRVLQLQLHGVGGRADGGRDEGGG